jgi:hypothetical protein
MTTTLEDLLLRAAELAGDDRDGSDSALAASLRARAAWVRKLESDGYSTSVMYTSGWRDGWRALTGPIPSETAPAATTGDVQFIMGMPGWDQTKLCTCNTYPHLPTCGEPPAAPREGTGGATAGEAKPTGDAKADPYDTGHRACNGLGCPTCCPVDAT